MSLKFVSWDVGIRNLAFALLKFQPSPEDLSRKKSLQNQEEVENFFQRIEILDWGVIDISEPYQNEQDNENQNQTDDNKSKKGAQALIRDFEEVEEIKKKEAEKKKLEIAFQEVLCQSLTSKKVKCGKPVDFLFKSNPKAGVCKLHKSKYLAEELKETGVKITCCQTRSTKTPFGKFVKVACKNKAVYALLSDLSQGYCQKHYKIVQGTNQAFVKIKETTPKLEKEELNPDDLISKSETISKDKKKTTGKKAKKQNIAKITRLVLFKNMADNLDNKYHHLCDVNEVIIENQPVLKNPVMKTVQSFLDSYFFFHGYQEGKIDEIKLFSASKKLNAYQKDLPVTQQLQIDKLSSKYQATKKKSIFCVKAMLREAPVNHKWIEYFEDHKKKDDLADAYMMGVYFIMKKYKA